MGKFFGVILILIGVGVMLLPFGIYQGIFGYNDSTPFFEDMSTMWFVIIGGALLFIGIGVYMKKKYPYAYQ